VRLPSGGAFHPKTILLGNAREAVLLVGSGNLGLGGIEQGHEVYASYASGEQPGAFASWRDWMDGIVRLVDDATLRLRWADLRARLPWLAAAAGTATFHTNWQRPLIEALLDGIAAPVDELLLTAPFFDADLAALTALVRRTEPKRITLYLGKGTSVRGDRLARLLNEHESRVVGWVPADFVHAKLIGIRTGSTGRVASGSANLSAPALLRAHTQPGANVEAEAVVSVGPGEVAGYFDIPGLEMKDLLMDVVEGLVLVDPEPEGLTIPIHLLAATLEPDSRVIIRSEPAAHAERTALTDGRQSSEIRDGVATSWDSADRTALVWLADGSGNALSNRVVLDDRRSLDAVLAASTHHREAPGDLDQADLEHPLGALLLELHRDALFDIDDTPAARRVAALQGSDPAADAEFWERYLNDELQLDPRAAHYGHRRTAAPKPLDSPLDWLLSQMLDRVPEHGVLRLLGGEMRHNPERPGALWTPNQRLQVRAFNILQRWCRALTDPRARWFGDMAPVKHFALLLATLCEIWAQRTWLPVHRLPALAETLFGAFIRTERSTGYLFGLDSDQREAALELVRQPAIRAKACALAIAALRDAKAEQYFSWQPFLIPGIEWGIFDPASDAAEQVLSLTGIPTTAREMESRLQYVARYTDDEHWTERLTRELAFDSVVLRRFPKGDNRPSYDAELQVRGDIDLLHDPRVITLAREGLDYTRSPGIRLRVGDTDVATFAFGYPAYARTASRRLESPVALSRDDVIAAARAGAGLDRILLDEHQRAS
jgi:hypothetical protein